MRVVEYAAGELRSGFVTMSSVSSSYSSSIGEDLFAWFAAKKEGKWGDIPAAVWVSYRSEPDVSSLALWKRGKADKHGPVVTGDFFDPGQHGPITSVCRPPLLPIGTISTTQTSARAVPGLAA